MINSETDIYISEAHQTSANSQVFSWFQSNTKFCTLVLKCIIWETAVSSNPQYIAGAVESLLSYFTPKQKVILLIIFCRKKTGTVPSSNYM